MLTLLATLVLLSVLILVHEFGHFFAAKTVDIEVRRFSLGMGPRVAGFRVGETEFILSALPIGGYVSMAGMVDDESEVLEGGHGEERQPSPRDFDSKPLWARVWVISAGVLMNFLFAVLVFAALAFFYGERVIATSTQVVVTQTQALPPGAEPLAEVPVGAELVSVRNQPVETWNDVQRELIRTPPGPVELQFADAPPVTFQLPAPDTLRRTVLAAIQPLVEPVIMGIQAGSAADAAGIQPGDRVVSAAGTPMLSWWQFQETIRAHPGQPLPLQIERNGEIIQVTVTPEAHELRPGETIGQLGVIHQFEVVELGAGQSLVRGFQDTRDFTGTILSFLGNLFTGHESPRQVGSILTIGQLSGEFARSGLQSFLWFMAVFSINLAVLNLLPIPILDGGHLMFMAIEAVRGRPLSVEQRIRLSHVGLIIVVGIMVWAMTNDVLRFLGI